jgi:hypothetical protein
LLDRYIYEDIYPAFKANTDEKSVVQRAPLKFAADHSSRGLNAFMDEARQAIEANGALLPIIESIPGVYQARCARGSRAGYPRGPGAQHQFDFRTSLSISRGGYK